MASVENNDRDLTMFYFSGARLPTGRVLLLSSAIAGAKVKESDQCQRYRSLRKKMMTLTTVSIDMEIKEQERGVPFCGVCVCMHQSMR